MPRVIKRSKNQVSDYRRAKKTQIKKYREKNLREHAADGIVIILKDLGKDEDRLYHIVKNNGIELHTFNIVGDEKDLRVSGECAVGFFDIKKEKHHASGFKCKYEYSGAVLKDNWGQRIIAVEEYEINIDDDLER
jgi:hypothetical protein